MERLEDSAPTGWVGQWVVCSRKDTVFRLFPPHADRLCPAVSLTYKVHSRTGHVGPKRE